MTDDRPSPFRGRRFTISRVMIDVLVAGVFLAGVASPQSPLMSTLAFFALCYFAIDLVFWFGPPLLRRVFRPSPPDPDDDGEEEIAYWEEEIG
jgi:hypothetical protein